MNESPIARGGSRRLIVEAAGTGAAYAAALWWASTCLVASFRPAGLPEPYWPGVLKLRTDTSGVVAFFVAAITLTLSNYLRVRRRHAPSARVADDHEATRPQAAALALSESFAALSTGLVIYISVNAVTHPATLAIQATHLLPWPTEGTLRVASLALAASSIAVMSYLRAGFPAPHYRPWRG